MFGLFSYHLWGRRHDTNKYFYLQEEENGLQRFKHEVYAFCLGKKHGDMRVLYLYSGWRRIGRAEMKDGKLHLNFRSEEIGRSYDEALEAVSRIPCFMSWLEGEFLKKYSSESTSLQQQVWKPVQHPQNITQEERREAQTV